MMQKNMKMDIEIDLTKKVSKVSPYIFGNFIEFINDCINRGMWAELIINRRFENNDENGDGVSDPWYPTGYNDVCKYSIDDEEVYNYRHSQKIEVVNHYGGYRGIAQANLRLFDKESYNGYIWMKGSDFNGTAYINIKSKSNYHYFSKKINLFENKWTKYDFSFASCAYDDNAIFEIAIYGEGKIWIDQVSLMPQSAVDGVWNSVVSLAQSLNMGIVRFPGGCFADSYNWKDGIGQKDKRPVRQNLHWKGSEENNFGTDEFIKFCRNVGCEPLICVNFGSGTPEEAADWVEYCNGGIDTKYGALRAANGNPEPYNVKYWEIGNEIFGEWEIGHCDVEEYASKYIEFYKAMKKKDNNIKIIACGGNGNDASQNWNQKLLDAVRGQLDYIALHFYAPQVGNDFSDNVSLYYGTVGAVKKYEEIIRDTCNTIELYAPGNKDIKVAVTEWNTMYNNNSFREHTLEAAIFNAGMLNMFIRNGNFIEICNFSDLVNGWQGGCIRCDRGEVYGTPSYYVLKLYSNSGIEYVVESKWQCETYDIDAVGHVKDVRNVPYIDTVACLGQNEVLIFVVNRHLERNAVVSLNIRGAKTRDYIVVSEITSNNSFDTNTLDNEFVKIKDSVIYSHSINEGILIPHCSVVRLRLPIAE